MRAHRSFVDSVLQHLIGTSFRPDACRDSIDSSSLPKYYQLTLRPPLPPQTTNLKKTQTLTSKTPKQPLMMFKSLMFSTLAVSTRAFAPSFGARALRTTTPLFSEDMKTGTVKWFNTQKGFGFIVPADGTSDVFVHQTAIISDGFRSLADGEEVQFKVVEDNNGRVKAVDVTGPEGADVMGAQRQEYRESYDDGY